MVMIMILGGIAAPGFFRFQDQRRVNQTQYLVYQGLRSTQREAIEKRQQYQFSLRDRQGQLEWANHPSSVDPTRVTLWQPLTPGVTLAPEDNTLTSSKGTYYVRFDFRG
ncbi:MAG: Tfp pilus assembly protein FimT/FimU, partial [Nodosilinea sp.]